MAPTPAFPPSNGPRTWLITSAASPIGLRLARSLLEHEDNVVLGALPSDLEYVPSSLLNPTFKDKPSEDTTYEPPDFEEDGERAEVFAQFLINEVAQKNWRQHIRVVVLDSRFGQCQVAIAEAIATFGALDVLFCCASEAILGTVEEIGASQRTQTLVRDQFETNLFGPINVIRAALPAMRKRKTGHIITLTGITSHLGTPGIGVYCASGWAIEGFCDSLAYEIAPFNIKLTIVQPNYEVPVLSNKISAAPTLPQYLPSSHPAPLARGMIGSLIDRIEGLGQTSEESTGSDGRRPSGTSDMTDSTDEQETKKRSHVTFSTSEKVTSVHPKLPQVMLDSLVAETVYAVATIGGHDNPPARHIVGHEGMASVKEKLKTVSEELEDFVECSGAADIDLVSDEVR